MSKYFFTIALLVLPLHSYKITQVASEHLAGSNNLGVSATIGVDLCDEKRLRVNLESQDDALYVGTLYVGAPNSQPVRVIFDTGSEHLAITSALCSNKLQGKYHFSEEDKFSKKRELEFL